ncbi:hypothetical protein ANACOL_01645 [Anaerotruncus colihominis DSM 17241]|uniref:Uncharacterized protein n=1 Tax=Anaerotruncus colihominis DSM 17241 TaxID=445972 RepID=B0PA76_9FIRM|nr:hypothetical protein ANACOL_01645 [Anaerotruncus colihominis DSM 17241]
MGTADAKVYSVSLFSDRKTCYTGRMTNAAFGRARDRSDDYADCNIRADEKD